MLGPPHSGKSVFAYLLFKTFRDLGIDAALFDCDLKAPTFRRFDLASAEEAKHIYATPNANKVDSTIPIEMFKPIIDFNFLAVREKGPIIMDGLGRHDELTEFLISKARILLIVCHENLEETEMRQCNYLMGNRLQHPFKFYSSFKKRSIKITTTLELPVVEFSKKQLSARIARLDRKGIAFGEIPVFQTKVWP